MNETTGKLFLLIRSCSAIGALWGASLGVFGVPSAMAMTMLKQVQVSNSSQVDLLFDGKVNKSQIQTEFFNDIIQLSMVDVTVYPAKISSVNGGLLTKVFAYQYAPRLVRCRLTVSGKAENYRDRLLINASGRLLTVRISDVKADRAEKASIKTVEVAKPAEKGAGLAVLDDEEKALLDRVINAPIQHPANKARPVVEVPKGAPLRMGGSKPLPSLTGVMMKLGLVLGIFGFFAFVLRKFMAPKGNSRNSAKFGGISEKEMASALGGRGIKGALGGVGRFLQGNFGKLGQKEKLIEVLSNHQLGPKQSIAVVRVCGRKMVIGIANDSITLISQLAGAGGLEDLADDFQGDGAMAGSPAFFADLLKKEQTRPSYSRPASPAPLSDVGVRARIRSRLEGLKPL